MLWLLMFMGRGGEGRSRRNDFERGWGGWGGCGEAAWGGALLWAGLGAI